MERLTGIGVSPGVVLGRAVVLTQRTDRCEDEAHREASAEHREEKGLEGHTIQASQAGDCFGQDG